MPCRRHRRENSRKTSTSLKDVKKKKTEPFLREFTFFKFKRSVWTEPPETFKQSETGMVQSERQRAFPHMFTTSELLVWVKTLPVPVWIVCKRRAAEAEKLTCSYLRVLLQTGCLLGDQLVYWHTNTAVIWSRVWLNKLFLPAEIWLLLCHMTLIHEYLCLCSL